MHARRSIVSALAIALAAGVLPAQSPTPAGAPAQAIPDSPIGLMLREWIDAFNNADSAKLANYYAKYQLDRNISVQLSRARMTGGLDLVTIERAKPRLIEAVWKERSTGRISWMAAELEDEGKPGMKYSYLMQLPENGSLNDFKVDAASRRRVIDAAIAKLHENYVFPEVTEKMATAVRGRLARGGYDDVIAGPRFAQLLTEDFQAVSRDKHLRVNFSASRIADRPFNARPDSAARAAYRADMERVNCGFEKTEVMPNNVGYIKFNFFADAEACGPTATKEMAKVADVDALIVDLRENGGGSPNMVAYVSSYLFSKRVHLNDLWTRRTNETNEYWTRPEVPGKKVRDDVPVYVLTANRTFSGAEEFSYNLKNLKRATIIGETTGGGAHPVSAHKIDDHFVIGVPFARAINPYSKTNWEGTGVTPDVKVPASDALAVALRMIAEKRATP
ncbi:MAG TPA: S41 family peptidase [Gemmatimonadaceae bacterium]|nr:S41 family peptidase [Gemmatimonadaceae bacterium]